MSTTPWGTMNGWLRIETEQRGAWMQQRVQDLRAARVAGLPSVVPVGRAAKAARPESRPTKTASSPAPRPESPALGDAEAA